MDWLQRVHDLQQAEVILRQLERFAASLDNIQGAEHLKHARCHIMGQLNGMSTKRAFQRSVPSVSRRGPHDNYVPYCERRKNG
jgi:hypothetical protein